MKRAIDWGLPLLAVALPVVAWSLLPRWIPAEPLESPLLTSATRASFPPDQFERIVPRESGTPTDPQPFLTHVQVLDLGQAGGRQLISVDAKRQRIVAWSLPLGPDVTPRVLAEDLPAPVAATPVDLDSDGDLDLAVALLGDLTPRDTLVGGVCWIENAGEAWQLRGLLSLVRSVADCRSGDLDADGDADLAVAVLGDGHGQVVWVQNLGPQGFRTEVLAETAGTARVELADLDADGDLDLISLGTREEVELLAFENLGEGAFRRRRLWSTSDPSICLNSLHAHDLDADGRPELLVTVGHPPHALPRATRPGQGCWRVTVGADWQGEIQRLGSLAGASDSAVTDWDADGDPDVVIVSGDGTPGTASVVLLENSGAGQFLQQTIDLEPHHRSCVALADVTGDSRPEIVTGGVYRSGPYTAPLGLVIWHDRGGD